MTVDTCCKFLILHIVITANLSSRNYFKEKKRIYIPKQEPQQSTWSALDDCVWQAPPWFDLKPCIGWIPVYQKLDRFFATLLMLKSPTWKDIEKQLEIMKAKRIPYAHELVCKIYRRLWRELEENTAGTEMLRLVHSENTFLFGSN
jgi:hypothetical protein